MYFIKNVLYKLVKIMINALKLEKVIFNLVVYYYGQLLILIVINKSLLFIFKL